MLDYEKDCQIDLNNLEKEWQRQQSLYMQYAEMLVEKEHERDLCKEAIEVARADFAAAKALLEIDIRSYSEKYDPPVNKKGEPDLKESWYSAALVSNLDKDGATVEAKARLSTLQSQLIELNRECSLLEHAVKSIAHQRKAALEWESELWCRGYWATPQPINVPQGVSKPEKRENVGAATEKQRESLSRRRRKDPE